MEFENLTFSLGDRVAEITLARPDKRNALSPEMRAELESLIDRLAVDDQVGAVIVTGQEDCFCAGADIREVVEFQGPADVHRFSRDINRLFNKIEALEKPVLAAVGGLALGGGCELALACDLRLAARNASFGLPEINIGVMPGGGGTQRLPRLIGAGRARELLYGGRPIQAEEAQRIGLVNRLVEPSELRSEAQNWARRLADQPDAALKMIKSAVNRGLDMPLKAALAYEARCFEMLLTSADSAEGLAAFLEGRRPRFKGR